MERLIAAINDALEHSFGFEVIPNWSSFSTDRKSVTFILHDEDMNEEQSRPYQETILL
jgi:hypothetical protein